MYKSLKTRLLFVIFIYLFITILIVAGIIYKAYSNQITTQLEKYFSEKINNTVDQLDGLIEQMDTVSSQLLSSHALQSMFFEANKEEYRDINYFEYNIEMKREAQAILWSYNSPSKLVENINVFGGSSYVGLRYAPDVTQIQDIFSSYRVTFNPDERYYVLAPHVDPLDHMNQSKVISLVRPFISARYGFMQVGIIEVQKAYSDIEAVCQTNDIDTGFAFTVFDDNGHVIYSEWDVGENMHDTLLTSTYFNDENNLYNISIEDINYSVSYLDVDNASWRVVLLQPTEIFIKPVREMLNQLIFIAVGITLIIYVSILFIVSKVTKPLKQLVSDIDQFDLKSDPNIHSSKIKEIEIVRATFIRLVNRIRDSADQLLIAKETELNLRMMTMQSQINPHFLYNSLTAISSVSLEEGGEKVPIMCHQLSQIFRYTSSNDIEYTTLEDEIENIQNYMDFMKWRYESTFEFNIIKEGNLRQIPLVRLVLQPFIENSFTHGFKHTYPPYNIYITCRATQEEWYFEIIDNGVGFTDNALSQLKESIKKIDAILDEKENYDRLKAEDKAILNIYIRLKLLYKDNMSFVIGNTKGQGAFVKIHVKKVDNRLEHNREGNIGEGKEGEYCD